MLQVDLSLGNHAQRVLFCLFRHHLFGNYKHVQIPQDMDSLWPQPPSLQKKKKLYIVLNCNAERLHFGILQISARGRKASMHTFLTLLLFFPWVHQCLLNESMLEHQHGQNKQARQLCRAEVFHKPQFAVAHSSTQWQTQLINISLQPLFVFFKVLYFLSYNKTGMVTRGSMGSY